MPPFIPTAIFVFFLPLAVTFLLINYVLGNKTKLTFPSLIKYLRSRRWGGFVLGLTIVIAIAIIRHFYEGFLLKKDFVSLSLGLIVLIFAGLIDDFRKLNWKIQLLVQSSVAFIAVSVGDTIDHVKLPSGGVIMFPWWIAALSAYLWIITIINSINWIDGIDGLAGSVSFIAFLTLAALSLSKVVNQPSTAYLCLLAAGSVLGFLFFNYPKAKVYLGTAGSWSLGFLIAVVSIYSGGKIATTALVLGIPLIDFLVVSLERIIRGKYPTIGGDRLHLHEKLRDWGYKPLSITLMLSFITLMFGIGTLLTQTKGKMYLFLPLAAAFFVFAILLNKKKLLRKK